jgi:hypothetical protein
MTVVLSMNKRDLVVAVPDDRAGVEIGMELVTQGCALPFQSITNREGCKPGQVKSVLT